MFWFLFSVVSIFVTSHRPNNQHILNNTTKKNINISTTKIGTIKKKFGMNGASGCTLVCGNDNNKQIKSEVLHQNQPHAESPVNSDKFGAKLTPPQFSMHYYVVLGFRFLLF